MAASFYHDLKTQIKQFLAEIKNKRGSVGKDKTKKLDHMPLRPHVMFQDNRVSKNNDKSNGKKNTQNSNVKDKKGTNKATLRDHEIKPDQTDNNSH